MTEEGIIQKVCNARRDILYRDSKIPNQYGIDSKARLEELDFLEKKLIKEISKLRVKPCELYCGFCEAQNANIQEIIGETKE